MKIREVFIERNINSLIIVLKLRGNSNINMWLYGEMSRQDERKGQVDIWKKYAKIKADWKKQQSGVILWKE